MLIYNYDPINNYFTGAVREIVEGEGIPALWTDEPVPTIPAGEWARYNNPGWILTSMEPPEQPIDASSAPVSEEQAVAQPGEAPVVI